MDEIEKVMKSVPSDRYVGVEYIAYMSRKSIRAVKFNLSKLSKRGIIQVMIDGKTKKYRSNQLSLFADAEEMA